MKISQNLKQAISESGYDTVGLVLADILRKKWRNVNYNSKTGTGNVDMGSMKVYWEESQNEDKVTLTLRPKTVRSFDGKQAAAALESIGHILNHKFE